MLLVVIGLIGDSIMCTPALAEARRLLPEAEIHVLTTGANEQLFRNGGWADAMHVYDGAAFPLRRGARRSLERQLRAAAFDTAVILLGDDFVPLLCRARVPRRVGIAGTVCAALLTDKYAHEDARIWGPDVALRALECLGLRPRRAVPSLPPPAGVDAADGRVLREMGVAPKSGYLLLHPFGSTVNRTLPRQKAAELADLLTNAGRRDVLIIGGSGDGQSAQDIVSRCAYRDGVHAVAGLCSLTQTAALMQQASAIVSTDSGPLHMAGALSRPAVGLFRAIRPEYARLYPTVTPLLWDGGPACLPACTWDSWYGCAVSPCRQLDGISNQAIVAAVSDCLTRAATPVLRT